MWKTLRLMRLLNNGLIRSGIAPISDLLIITSPATSPFLTFWKEARNYQLLCCHLSQSLLARATMRMLWCVSTQVYSGSNRVKDSTLRVQLCTICEMLAIRLEFAGDSLLESWTRDRA